jgi:GrpB-like predicted nucleotidyltransferase (UPF0157 family)
MTDASSDLDRAIHEDVNLVPYDTEWPTQFDLERQRLLAKFPQLLAIEHFGSTAIAGMPSKPIIDILAGVESMAVADSLFEPILNFAYTTSRSFNAMLPDRRWFMRASGGRRTHHLHVVVLGSECWRQRIHFRDALRLNPDLARRYATLKLELAAKFKQDREAYTNAKSEFVASVVGMI